MRLKILILNRESERYAIPSHDDVSPISLILAVFDQKRVTYTFFSNWEEPRVEDQIKQCHEWNGVAMNLPLTIQAIKYPLYMYTYITISLVISATNLESS